VYAVDCPNAIDLKVGDKVIDCDRVGLKKDYAKDVEEDLLIANFNRKIAEDEAKIAANKDKRIEDADAQAARWEAENEKTRQQLIEEQKRGKVDFWIGFASGFVTILLGAIAIKEAAK
jgi:hypothetical protein